MSHLKLHLKDNDTNKKFWAWIVHLFTASGAVFGLLAIIAIIQQEWQLAFMWMAIAAFVDAVDGTLARQFGVKGVLPEFDGALLDNIIDYQTYVVIPALFVYKANLLSETMAIIIASIIVLSSAYQFCQSDAKTDDHFFKGFPSYWNVVVFYLFMLGTSQTINLIVLVVCGLLVFVPFKYIYPSRMTRFQKLTLMLSIIWGVMVIIPLVQYPDFQPWLIWASLLYIAYYIGISGYLTKTADN